ncbi:MAG: TonB family protein [Bryobacterales bacterium]|nr:TonB family protein [Bryobacterales bacterium]
MPPNLAADALFTEFNVREDTDKPHFLRLHDNFVKGLEGYLDDRPEAAGWLLGQVDDGGERVIHVTGFLPASAEPGPGILGIFRRHQREDWLPDGGDLAGLRRFQVAGPAAFLSLRAVAGELVGVLYLLADGVFAEGRRTVEFPFSLAALTGAPASAVQPQPKPAAVQRKRKQSSLWGWVSGAAGLAGVLCLAALWNLGVLDEGVSAPEVVSAEPAPVLAPVYGTPEPVRAAEPEPEPAPAVVASAPPRPLTPGRPAKPAVRPFTVPSAAPTSTTSPAVAPAAPEIRAGAELQVLPLPAASVAPAAAPPPVIVPPKPVRQVTTNLPVDVRRRIQGEVVVKVRVSVDAAGSVTAATAETGSPEVLREAALTAARQWQFEPARENGSPVPGHADLLFRFAGRR